MDPVIEFRNVTYQYPLTETPAVKNIDLSLEPGKLYGIIGPNGAGKTTLAVMMCGFIPSFYKGTLSGELRIKGRNILEYKKGEISRISGYVFQNPFTQISGVKDTVFEEIGFALENFGADPAEMEERILNIAEQTGITELLEKSPYELSGGQQQRLCIARALAISPSILLMDEPTSALDPISTSKIEDLIHELKKEYTIVIVTHNMQQAARVSDKTGYFYLGELVEYGDTRKIFTNPEKESTQNYITGRFG